MLWPLDKANQALGGSLKLYSSYLWDHVHQGGKVFVWNDAVTRILRKNPELDPYAVKTMIAEYVNDSMGGQLKYKLPINTLNKLWSNPKNQKFLGRFWLAPDWTYSAQSQFWKMTRMLPKNVAIKEYYGDPKMVRKVTASTYGRYWTLGMVGGVFTSITAIKFMMWVLDGNDPEEFKIMPDKPEDVFNIDISPIEKKTYKGLYNLGAMSKESYDRNLRDIGRRKTYAGFGKQFKEVLTPLAPAANALVGGVFYGNNIGHEVGNFTKRQRETFSRKMAPALQHAWEFATGTTTSGFELPESYIKDDDFFEIAKIKLSRLSNIIVPISIREGTTQFANALPKGQVLSEFAGRERIKQLLTVYADVDRQFDIEGIYGKGAGTNISYPDFVSNLDNLMPELLTEIKKNNPGLDVGKMYDQAIKDVRNYYFNQFWQLYNPVVRGKERPFSDVDVKKLLKLSFNMGRLHMTGKMLHKKLDSKGQKVGFSVGYGAPEYKEYMEFADSLINNFPYKELSAPINFNDKTEFQIWKEGIVDSVWYKPKLNYKKQPWE